MPRWPDVVILGGARTPMAEYVGAFKDVSALELGAHAAPRGPRADRACQPAWVDHVVMGNALQTSGDAIYGARHVGLKAGVPVEVPALTVNRLCGSGHPVRGLGGADDPAGRVAAGAGRAAWRT